MVGMVMMIAATAAGRGLDFVYGELMGLMMVVMTAADRTTFLHDKTPYPALISTR